MRNLSLPHKKLVYNRDMKQQDFDAAIMLAATSSDDEDKQMQQILEYSPYPMNSKNLNIAIKEASLTNKPNMMKVLLKDGRVDPTIGNNYPLRIARQMGYRRIVDMLMADPRVQKSLRRNRQPPPPPNPEYYEHFHQFSQLPPEIKEHVAKYVRYPKDLKALARTSQEMRAFSRPQTKLVYDRATKQQQFDNSIMDALMSYSDDVDLMKRLLAYFPYPMRSKNLEVAIENASATNKPNIVKALLEDGRADPTTGNNYPLKIAQNFGRKRIVDMLMADPRVQRYLQRTNNVRQPTDTVAGLVKLREMQRFRIRKLKMEPYPDLVEIARLQGKVDELTAALRKYYY